MNRQQICEHVGKLITGERNETHGDPFTQFTTSQQLKVIASNARLGRPNTLTSSESEALDMILTKISRIVNGTPISDHWYDIIGYAAIAAEARDKINPQSTVTFK